MVEQAASKIWVDADATPRPVKDMLFRAAERTQREVILVANQPLEKPRSRWVRSVQVAAGFDVADNYIVRQAQSGDLVITADIPLAAELVEAKVAALSPRGELFTTENVRQRLNMRDFNETMRSSGLHTGGPAAYGQADKQAFANALDRWLARNP